MGRIMLEGITVVSTFPFLLHVLTAVGVVFEVASSYSKDDVISYWIDAALNCYSLVPRNSPLSHYLTYVQATLAIVAFLAHTSNKLEKRKIGYGILLIMYTVTQLRLLFWGFGIEVIAYLYTNITIFSILVLYNDSLRLKSIKGT
ncbi:uncharacterized protein LOC123556981 [Mercenaria mercenaria]|uniref:uncharacterized protein LOC123556981 n=1 Tax=Mercenaria mercenaria TaxID=6596 RepID=UPI00234F9F7C|nr:uncharacterized protein LOC123556981 [Mercenaria mercenaria]